MITENLTPAHTLDIQEVDARLSEVRQALLSEPYMYSKPQLSTLYQYRRNLLQRKQELKALAGRS